MTSESLAYLMAMYVVVLAVGVQLGALWGARVVRSDAAKREQAAYDEGFDDGATRKPRRWHR
jgi:hypothetical protein